MTYVQTVISPTELAALLRYDAETGIFHWRPRPIAMFKATAGRTAAHNCNSWNAGWANRQAFTSRHSAGYLVAGVNGKKLFAHRVAWALVTGKWPDHEIDHVNGDRGDNRFSNLRDVTTEQNARNKRPHPLNTSGMAGVRWNAERSKWTASAHVRGRFVHLGVFEDLRDAKAARAAFNRANGFHPNHGVEA